MENFKDFIDQVLPECTNMEEGKKQLFEFADEGAKQDAIEDPISTFKY